MTMYEPKVPNQVGIVPCEAIFAVFLSLFQFPVTKLFTTVSMVVLEQKMKRVYIHTFYS